MFKMLLLTRFRKKNSLIAEVVDFLITVTKISKRNNIKEEAFISAS